MPLVTALIAPHSPLLIKTVSGEQTQLLAPTLNSLEQMAVELAQARVETIIVVGDHGQLRPDTLTLAQPPHFIINLKEFGDVVTTRELEPDVHFGNAVREYGETNLSIITVAPTQLSYVIGVPLLLLTPYLPAVRICCFGPALLPVNDHVALGAVLRHVSESTSSRVALLAAGDLPEGNADFVAVVKNGLTNGNLYDLAKQTRWADTPQGIAWRNLVIMGAALNPSSWQTEILSYQNLFGTGLLTAIIRP